VLPPYIPPEPYGIATAGLESSLMDYGASLAKAAVETATAAGVQATSKVDSGSPPEIICQVAEAEGADMIVIGKPGPRLVQAVHAWKRVEPGRPYRACAGVARTLITDAVPLRHTSSPRWTNTVAIRRA